MGMVLCASTTVATAAPWLGLVKTGTTTQTNDTISLGTSFYDFDVRFDSSGNPVNTLQFAFYTAPTNTVTFGTPAITALSNPFLPGDIWTSPADGSLLTNYSWTILFKGSGSSYAAFINNVATYQLNTSTLATGEYVFSFLARPGTDDEYLGWSSGNLYVNDFAAPGSFVLDIVGVPEPGTWALMVVGGLVAGWKVRRRRNAR